MIKDFYFFIDICRQNRAFQVLNLFPYKNFYLRLQLDFFTKQEYDAAR